MAYTSFSRFITRCGVCNQNTNRAYAKAHGGKCKACATGVPAEPRYKCPQCGGAISKYKHDHHYVCDGCYRDNDPIGYANEVRGMCDYQPDY